MYKVSIEVNSQQLEHLIDRLPIGQKIKLLRKLEQQTLSRRWRSLLRDIDRRLKKFPVSSEEISQEISAYRQAKRKHA